MNWISNIVRPKIRGLLEKRDVGENLWVKCPESGELVFHKDLEANQYVIPGSGYHMKIGARDRLGHLFDEGKFREIKLPKVAIDPLKFRDQQKYTDRLKAAKAKTDMEDAVIAAIGPKTKLVAITHLSNVLGTKVDVKAICAAAKALRACARLADDDDDDEVFMSDLAQRENWGECSVPLVAPLNVSISLSGWPAAVSSEAQR